MHTDSHAVGRVLFENGDFLVMAVVIDRKWYMGRRDVHTIATRVNDELTREVDRRVGSTKVAHRTSSEDVITKISNILVTINVVRG